MYEIVMDRNVLTTWFSSQNDPIELPEKVNSPSEIIMAQLKRASSYGKINVPIDATLPRDSLNMTTMTQSETFLTVLQ